MMKGDTPGAPTLPRRRATALDEKRPTAITRAMAITRPAVPNVLRRSIVVPSSLADILWRSAAGDKWSGARLVY